MTTPREPAPRDENGVPNPDGDFFDRLIVQQEQADARADKPTQPIE